MNTKERLVHRKVAETLLNDSLRHRPILTRRERIDLVVRATLVAGILVGGSWHVFMQPQGALVEWCRLVEPTERDGFYRYQ